jgi:alpha-D-ribose 1-methylphosphonate 5-triphosphate synthase subunit PhnH
MVQTSAGFGDPVFDAQAVFRAVMRGMSRPGRIERIEAMLTPPPPLNKAAAASCLALADFETPIWLSPTLLASPAADYLRFHSGASIVHVADHAAFALIDARGDVFDLGDFAQGTAEYPDRSTTLILLCETLTGPDPFVVSGPGLAKDAFIRFAPRPADFDSQWLRNRDSFPLGVDLIVTAGDAFTCLPRSARLREAA